ncbi:MAG TPA: hypothetical protein VMZ91_11740 [Candidatus Paceibacterota bacterium]|nr:hypothetical protein [Candidatus Paceibacterota bacterium]
MKVDIPITNLEFRELIIILKRYPKGVIKVKEKNAIWETDLDLTSNIPTSSNPESTGEVAPRLTGKGNIFSNMADSISSSFG